MNVRNLVVIKIKLLRVFKITLTLIEFRKNFLEVEYKLNFYGYNHIKILDNTEFS